MVSILISAQVERARIPGREELMVLAEDDINEDEDNEELAGDRSLVDNGENRGSTISQSSGLFTSRPLQTMTTSGMRMTNICKCSQRR